MRNHLGRFEAGPDPDRHAFTRAERRRGYREAQRRASLLRDGGRLYAWVFYKVRGWYREQR